MSRRLFFQLHISGFSEADQKNPNDHPISEQLQNHLSFQENTPAHA